MSNNLLFYFNKAKNEKSKCAVIQWPEERPGLVYGIINQNMIRLITGGAQTIQEGSVYYLKYNHRVHNFKILYLGNKKSCELELSGWLSKYLKRMNSQKRKHEDDEDLITNAKRSRFE